MDAIAEQTDKLHVLVNNAGTTWGEPLMKYQDRGTVIAILCRLYVVCGTYVACVCCCDTQLGLV